MMKALFFAATLFACLYAEAQRYPSASSPSVSLTGQNVPNYADYVGAINPSGDLVGLKVDAAGNLLSSALVSYLFNGAFTNVNQDTVTPANSRPMPVRILNTVGAPYDLATEATLAAMSAKLPAVLGQTTLANSLSVGIASDQVVPISATSLPLPTGAATEATLSSIDAKIPTNGQKAMAGSIPVVLSSDQSAVAVTGTFWQATQPVSMASLPLPTGAATEATLSTMNGKIPANLTVSSTRLLVDGSGVTQPVSVASLPLPAGASTSALQTTGNASLASIDGKIANDYGSSAGAVRTASQVGNATGVADFGSGATSAQTIRVVPASDYIPPAAPVPSAGTVKQAAITVGTTAVRITTDGSAPSATRRRLNYMLDPASAATCYMGSATVSTAGASRGLLIFPGATQEYADDAADYYMICDTAAQTVFITEVE